VKLLFLLFLGLSL